MPQTATDSELSPKQLAVISSLIAGCTVTEAAEAVGVDRSTIHRWLSSDAAFIADYNRQRLDLVNSQQARLRTLSDKSLSVLEKLLDDEQVSPSVRLRAAMAIVHRQGLSRASIGPTDAAEIEREWEQNRMYRECGILP